MLNSEKIKPVAIAIIELHLSERITNAFLLSQSKYLAGLWVKFYVQKPQTFMIPIYSANLQL